MSRKNSLKDSSGSSSGSPNHTPFFNELFIKDLSPDVTDLTLLGSPAPTFVRTSTVRRVGSLKKEKQASFRQDKVGININRETQESNENGEIDNVYNKLDLDVKSDLVDGRPTTITGSADAENDNTRYRKYSESSLSLESIIEHEYKTISPASVLTGNSNSNSNSVRGCSSSLSSSDRSDDNARRSSTTTDAEYNGDLDEGTIKSPGSSYLTWIESVHSEFFGSVPDCADADGKVGEWNSFWLNYNNARGRYSSTPYLSAEDKTTNETSEAEARSICSTRQDVNEKTSGEYVSLTLDEVNEAIKCSQRVTEILRNAVRRSDLEFTENMDNSYYSDSISRQNSSIRDVEVTREDIYKAKSTRERSMSHAVTVNELMKQKEMLKPTVQSSSTSCINALLNTGVADILKRVISKRRDVMSSEGAPSMTRSSFSEWSTK